MRSRIRALGLVVGLGASILVTGACTDTFLEAEPGDDPVAFFDQLWGEFDRHYAFFNVKGIDWNALREEYRPMVDESTTDGELLTVFSRMLDHLEDGHVNVFTPHGVYRYTGWRDAYPENFNPPVAFSYLQGGRRSAGGGRLTYGRVSPELGYLHLSNFDPGRWPGDVDRVLEELEGIRALVLDIRGNGGGTDITAGEILGRLVDERTLYRYFSYRNGPGHEDFSALEADHIEPAGDRRFWGPVALLTNRANYSTAEDFVLGIRARGDAVVVGDTTGGGSGNPIHRELANGWTYRLSRWRLFDARRVPFPEGVGLAPDVHVMLDPGEPTRDAILERAMEELSARLR